MMDPSKVIIHCSSSPRFRGDDRDTIDRWHKERGFREIGYAYVILEDGTIQKGRSMVGPGAHCKGYNDWTGICLIGRSYPTDAQAKALLGLLDELGAKEVKGHYAFSSKTCPNFDVEKFMEDSSKPSPKLSWGDRIIEFFKVI